MAWGISGKKLNFKGEFMCHISFPGKKLKSKVYVLQNMSVLFGSDWIVLFDLWQLLINSYCNRVDISSKSTNNETEKLVEDLKNCFPCVFLEDHGKCVKTKMKFELKENVKLVFKPNRKVPFAASSQWKIGKIREARCLLKNWIFGLDFTHSFCKEKNKPKLNI